MGISKPVADSSAEMYRFTFSTLYVTWGRRGEVRGEGRKGRMGKRGRRGEKGEEGGKGGGGRRGRRKNKGEKRWVGWEGAEHSEIVAIQHWILY